MSLPIYDQQFPLSGPVLIYGVGEIGLFLREYFEELGGIEVLGFLDTFKKGSAQGMAISHPYVRAYPVEGVTVVLSTYAVDEVTPLLEEVGYTKIIYGVPFFLAISKLRAEQSELVSKLLEKGHFQQAIDTLSPLIKADPQFPGFYTLLAMAHRGLESLAAVEVFVGALKRFPNMALYRSPYFKIKQKEAIGRGLPSIYLNTQFKSGSVFLRSALCQGLEMPWMFLSPEGYHEALVEAWRQEFSLGGAVCQHHTPFGPDYQRVYQEPTQIKFVLHLRDPRQSALSAVHHYERVLKNGPDYARHNILLDNPDGYGTWPFEKKLDFFLGLVPEFSDPMPNITSFRKQVGWIDGWLEALEMSENARIIVTDYTDLQKGQEHFVRLLLERCGISADQFEFTNIRQQPVPGQSHFRKGDPNEWKSAMTLRQIEAANAMMTPRLRDRYG